MKFTKSDYMLYLRHPAWLWLKKHHPEKLPPISESTQAIFDTGYLFESYAEQLFPDALRLGFDGYKEYATLPARTKEALDNGASTIFQGRFEYGQLTFICDVLQVVGENTVDLIEIKSSTRAKPEHILDLAFQMVVLEGCGYTVRNISVIHVDNSYVRDGKIDPKLLTHRTDVTEAVKAERETTHANIAEALKVLDSPVTPDISPVHAKLGSFNDWLPIYKSITNCPDDSVYSLCGLNAKLVQRFEADKITKLLDIPSDFALGTKQTMQLQATRERRALINREKIKEYLDTFTYPLFFFDYETMSGVVPQFDGLRPYCQLPFQYSLHILDSPDAELRHVEYLHRDTSNPAVPLSETLASQIGPTGTILAWNMSFEKNCNKLLGSLSPAHADFYEDMNSRMVDLMVPFSNCWYVDGKCQGSASIKKVLPALVPELSYKTLGIQDGGSAQRLWMEAILEDKHPETKQKILDDLVEYCGLDTLAMVEIYKKLRAL